MATTIFYTSHPGKAPSTIGTGQSYTDQIVVGSTFSPGPRPDGFHGSATNSLGITWHSRYATPLMLTLFLQRCAQIIDIGTQPVSTHNGIVSGSQPAGSCPLVLKLRYQKKTPDYAA